MSEEEIKDVQEGFGGINERGKEQQQQQTKYKNNFFI